MTFPMPTDTAHVRLRTRQYRILSFDLGEGIERASIKVAATIALPWFLLLGVLGVSPLHRPYFYLVPVALLTLRAVGRDAGGRLRIRGWLDSFRRPGPIVNADTASSGGGAAITARIAFAVHPDEDVYGELIVTHDGAFLGVPESVRGDFHHQPTPLPPLGGEPTDAALPAR